MIYSTFFSKKFTLPLFYWHFKNMLYNIFSSKPPISPLKTPSKPYLFSSLSASFVAKKSKIHAFFADTGKFLIINLHLWGAYRVLVGSCSGTCSGTCSGITNLVVLSTLLLDEYAIMEQTENTYYNFLFLTSSSKSINSSSSSLSALFIA